MFVRFKKYVNFSVFKLNLILIFFNYSINYSSSKSDIRGIFRGLFSNNEDKPSNEVAFAESEPEKKTFSKKLKSRLSSFRLSRRNKLLSNENLNMRCSYNQIPSPDKVDNLNTTTLSSILKTSKSTRSFSKKKLRFQDDNSSVNFKSVETYEVPQTPEVDEMSEDDLAYYKQLKEDLIKRSVELVKKSPLKRKYSTVSTASDSQGNLEKFTKLDEHVYYYPPVECNVEKLPLSDKSENMMIQHGICTYVWSSPVNERIPTVPLDDSNIDQCSNQPSDNNDTLYEDKLKNPNNISILPINSDSSFSCSEILLDFTNSTDVYHRKVTSAKKSNRYRYNPMSKLESCSVALLSKGHDDINKMSWCSV